MAGSFGFEADHYDISMKVGKQRLLPAVRKDGADTRAIADGFSCHAQIEQGACRTPLHLAEVIQMALREAPYLTSHDHGPSLTRSRLRTHREPQQTKRRRMGAGTATALGVGALVGGLLAWGLSQSQNR
jgi:hypothetical protein